MAHSESRHDLTKDSVPPALPVQSSSPGWGGRFSPADASFTTRGACVGGGRRDAGGRVGTIYLSPKEIFPESVPNNPPDAWSVKCAADFGIEKSIFPVADVFGLICFRNSESLLSM